MDTERATRVTAALDHLTGLGPRAPLTNDTYTSNIRANWEPYARQHGLPVNFTGPGARALTLDEVKAFTGALAAGTAPKAHTKNVKAGALSPPRFEGLLSALRRAHRQGGLTWVGDIYPDELAALRAGYRRMHGTPPKKAKPMGKDHLGDLFDTVPDEPNDLDLAGCVARALSVQTHLPLGTAAKLTPASVVIAQDGALLHERSGDHEVPCTAWGVVDPVARASCAHCLLTQWVRHTSDPQQRLLGNARLHLVRNRARELAGHVQGASLDGDVLRVEGTPSSPQQHALIWSRATARWVRTRAAVLIARAIALRLDDLEHLDLVKVRWAGNTVTLNPLRKNDPGDGTPFPLTATGTARCPVNALRVYDDWVRVFLLDRKLLFTAVHRGGGVAYPVEWDDRPTKRYLYHDTRLDLIRYGGTEAGDALHVLDHLTPHSARRGWAAQARAEGLSDVQIQAGLGHVKASTTYGYLDPDDDSPKQLFGTINQHRNTDRV